ncbi:hypothetical protein J2W57_001204 [Chryseobacterium ginsenosidimutans]|uniref:Uncharacterized protein n=1 Tax=Chryseobacterium geocarposphaerae TaxID=1416776 RepID=A0ABU1LEB8_9FLAO|nr:hypothetical protein [Chryseobacterium geocarposphaerae]MDR6697844.1 hypothetical protein [Chryseobacterium ginsenosidimutans]
MNLVVFFLIDTKIDTFIFIINVINSKSKH